MLVIFSAPFGSTPLLATVSWMAAHTSGTLVAIAAASNNAGAAGEGALLALVGEVFFAGVLLIACSAFALRRLRR